MVFRVAQSLHLPGRRDFNRGILEMCVDDVVSLFSGIGLHLKGSRVAVMGFKKRHLSWGVVPHSSI